MQKKPPNQTKTQSQPRDAVRAFGACNGGGVGGVSLNLATGSPHPPHSPARGPAQERGWGGSEPSCSNYSSFAALGTKEGTARIRSSTKYAIRMAGMERRAPLLSPKSCGVPGGTARSWAAWGARKETDSPNYSQRRNLMASHLPSFITPWSAKPPPPPPPKK